MAKILSYSAIGIMLVGLLTIGAYMFGFTDDVRNVACGMQAVIVGAFCCAVAFDDRR